MSDTIEQRADKLLTEWCRSIGLTSSTILSKQVASLCRAEYTRGLRRAAEICETAYTAKHADVRARYEAYPNSYPEAPSQISVVTATIEAEIQAAEGGAV